MKVVQSWGRSPAFRFVPEEMRECALASVPFEAEPRVYRSDLADRLPPGLTMPRAYAVVDLDAESTALWLEDVPVSPRAGTGPRSPTPRSCSGGSPRARGSGRWRRSPTRAAPDAAQLHRGPARPVRRARPARRRSLAPSPRPAAAFDDTLRRDLVAAADTLPAVLAELEALPHGAAPGDACTRNLLVAADRPELVLIDFGFWGPQPYGFDLGQLLLGEVQLGERPAAALPDDERACLAAYVDGAAGARTATSTAQWSSAASRW